MSDPVVERRVRIARVVRLGKRVGYSLFLIAIVLFFVGFATEFSGELTSTIVACMVIEIGRASCRERV